MNSPKVTPAIEHAIIMPGIIGLENSNRCRNQKLIAALCSGDSFKFALSSSTIGAENLAPPTLGNNPKNAGIAANKIFTSEHSRRNALTMSVNAPLNRNSISRHITKYSARIMS